MSETPEKRKTHTSSEVKRRYNQKAYTQIVANAPKELAQRFKDACKERGDSQAGVIKKAIEAYLE